MYYIIYLSAGTKWFTEVELKELLAISNANNICNNITGLLLYSNGNFIQLLEGDEADVQKTFQKINSDERHKGITHIASGGLKERNFPQWGMGFKAVDMSGLSSFEDYFNLVTKPLSSANESHIAIKLLKAFIRTARMLPAA